VVYRWDSIFAGGHRLVEADGKPVDNGPLLDPADFERAMEEHVIAEVERDREWILRRRAKRAAGKDISR